MQQFKGKSVLKGIAIGKIFVFDKGKSTWVKSKIQDPDGEIARVNEAREKAKAELDIHYEEAMEKAGEAEAMIFDMQKLMLDDLDYQEAIEGHIRSEMVNAEYAVTITGEEFATIFTTMEDEYMQGRAEDVLNISKQLVRILEGREEPGLHTREPVIVLAENLSPSETIHMDKSKILAFVTQNGSANSHTAILAGALNIPALVNTEIEVSHELHGKTGIVDGMQSVFTVDPEESFLQEKKEELKQFSEKQKKLRELIGKENVTKDGRRIKLYANMGNVEDVDKVLSNDAGGIGLFRSEFLYLGKEDFPTEEEQFAAYKEVVSRMQGKKVIIRTLDLGADKQADYFTLDKEDNPAMGYRAIRICLTRPEIFCTQLRAIYRASAFGTVSIMFPMIISAAEVKKIKEITEQIKAELTAENIEFGEVELGIMVETPAAALISDELAKEVDFFSIGTNDLTQYTLAIDRQNEKLDSFYDSHHAAVLKLIELTVKNGHKEGIWVGICGELAADDTLTEKFLTMGVDELSVSPTHLLRIREKIRSIG